MTENKTNKTYETNKTKPNTSYPICPIGPIGPIRLIPPHGGYRKLISYQTASIIYDLTVIFCKKFLDYKSRTNDQMVQAARSGVQNIAEGSQTSGTSKKTELKLVGVARASLEELLRDYEDFLRQRGLSLWDKNDPKTRTARNLSYLSNRSSSSYLSYLDHPESAANCLICLLHQANYLLDKQLQRLEDDFVKNGGFTERLYTIRKSLR